MNTGSGKGGAPAGMPIAVPPERLRQLQRLAERAVRGRRRGGGHVIARMESRDGSWCWEGAATGADAEATPLRPGTPFHLASVTKMYTAVLVLRLAAKGRLALTDPITAHLPAELSDRLHVLDGQDRTAAITVEHLLAHASGLPDYFTDAPRGRPSLAARLTAGGDQAWTVADVADRVRRLRPHFPPQDLDQRRVKVRYSDSNHQLLGAIVEAATGATFAAALRDEVLEPLGLRDTWMAGTEAAAQHPEPAPIRSRGGHLDLPLAFARCGRTGDSSAPPPTRSAFCASCTATPMARSRR